MKNKIEDLIREDFLKREIQPNANAFERLSEKLEKQAVSKRKKWVRVLAYAASLVGIIFLLKAAFKTGDGTSTDKRTITNVQPKGSAVAPVDEKATVIAVEEPENTFEDTVEITKTSKVILITESKATSFSKKVTPPAEVKEQKAIVPQTTTIAIVADTFKLPIDITEVTDAELDALLAAANQTLPKNGGDSISINAKSMLYEIEVEINKPLPEKVMLTLKTSITTVKELVKSTEKENN
jgi:hypothetical protein